MTTAHPLPATEQGDTMYPLRYFMRSPLPSHWRVGAGRLRQIVWVAVAVVAWAAPSLSWAASPAVPTRQQTLPAPVIDGLRGLLGTVGEPPAGTLSTADATTVIDFVEKTPSDKVIYHAGKAFPAPSAYHRFDIGHDMATFLSLSFSPTIPSYALMPSSVRFSKWLSEDGTEAPFPDLSGELDALDTPRVFRGIEYMENTPDTHSGAYYSYYLYRTLILMRNEGRLVLVSMSKQKDVSNTGKKGVVLGKDDNWAYLYSEQDGLTVPGMGWIKSYMYDSSSVNVYIQSPDEPMRVRCGVFKWVRAGWSSINMVRPHHIYAGLIRYSESFSTIVDDPRLPSARQMTAVIERINNASMGELRATFQRYLEAIEGTFGTDASFPRKWFAKWFRSPDYLAALSEDQLKATLVVEYVRQILGKPSCIDMSPLLGVRRRAAG